MTPSYSTLACVRLAISSHAGQTRRLLNTPYIIHPIRVACILEEIQASDDVIRAGILHDVIEDREPYDPEFMYTEVVAVAGVYVAEIVDLVSEIKQSNGADMPWSVRVAEAHKRLIASGNHDAWLVKTADILDNTRDLITSITTFGIDEVQKHFNAPIADRCAKACAFLDIVVEHFPENRLIPELSSELESLKKLIPTA